MWNARLLNESTNQIYFVGTQAASVDVFGSMHSCKGYGQLLDQGEQTGSNPINLDHGFVWIELYSYPTKLYVAVS